MRATRPPRRAAGLLCLLLTAPVPSAISGQELVLPDFELPGRQGTIMTFPEDYPDPSAAWSVVPLHSRRIYPLAEISQPEPPMNRPEFSTLLPLPPLAMLYGVKRNMPIFVGTNPGLRRFRDGDALKSSVVGPCVPTQGV